MINFIKIITILILTMIAIDHCVGILFDYLMSQAQGGDTWRNEYVAKQAKDDIIIMGSSRAIHHYNPLIIEDALGSSCYNIGEDGYGIILFYGKYELLSNRYHPHCIIYDVEHHFDLNAGDESKYLSKLRPYYCYPGIDSILISIDPSEKYKCHSSLFRFNSKFIQIIGDCCMKMHEDIKGFRPNYGVLETVIQEPSELHVSAIKYYYLEKLVKACNNHHTQLVFALSPVYRDIDAEVYSPITQLSDLYHIPLLNHLKDSIFLAHPEWFSDSYHLNNVGADIYSRLIAQELIKLGIQ